MDFSEMVSEVRLSYILDFVFRLEYIWIDNTNIWCGVAMLFIIDPHYLSSNQ